MAIEILSEKLVQDELGNTRYVEIAISDGQDTLLWRVGGLPVKGDLQAILETREAELWQAASAVGAENGEQLQERRDLRDLATVTANEIAYLDTAIATIDQMAAAQVRDVVKRLCQENRQILKALRFIVRRLD